MKKFLALALSATMMFSVAACGDKETNGTETQSTQTSESTVTTESEVVEEELTYPLDTDIKLTVWDSNFVKINDEYSSYKESPFHMGLEERTGVEINWTWPVAGADLTQAWNLLMTEKELPDIIFRSWSVSQAEQLMKDGAIYDLTEYLPKYAPDYWAAVNQPEYINSLKAFTTSDGKTYGSSDIGEHIITVSRNDVYPYKTEEIEGYAIKSVEINSYRDNNKITYVNTVPVFVEVTKTKDDKYEFNTFGTVEQQNTDKTSKSK